MTDVFVVDRAAFFGGAWPQGFVPMAGADADAFLERARELGRFVPRAAAEATPAWKQWIPYCVLRCAAPAPPAGRRADPGILVVRRTRGQSEARLHGAVSVGLGGHVEPPDAARPPGEEPDGPAFFAAALRRELLEELDFGALDLPAPGFCGLLNDDSTEVGAVHAGLVYALDLPLSAATAARTVAIRETSKMAGGFTHLVDFFELWQNPRQFETWSSLLIQAGIADPVGDSRSIGAAVRTGEFPPA